MATYRLTDIVWDTDGEEVSLPTVVVINDVGSEDQAVDAATDRHGFCICHAEVERVTNLRLV